MSSIGILGLGEWGTALSVHTAKLFGTVISLCRSEEVAEEINLKRTHSRVSNGTVLPENLRATTEVADLQGVEIVIVALPSKALPSLASLLPKICTPETILVSATKGLHPSTADTPLQFFEKVGIASQQLCVLSGPSFSSDLLHGRPLSLVAASQNRTLSKTLAARLSGAMTRVYSSGDPRGVELGGILKNVIAIAAGISDGLGLGSSSRAAVITRGLSEIVKIAHSLGAENSTLFGLSGLGDLVMTCSDDRSRNRRVGLALGRGEKIAAITQSLGSTAEGVHTAALVSALAKKHELDVPITNQVLRVIHGDVSVDQVAKELLARPLKSEND